MAREHFVEEPLLQINRSRAHHIDDSVTGVNQHSIQVPSLAFAAFGAGLEVNLHHATVFQIDRPFRVLLDDQIFFAAKPLVDFFGCAFKTRLTQSGRDDSRQTHGFGHTVLLDINGAFPGDGHALNRDKLARDYDDHAPHTRQRQAFGDVFIGVENGLSWRGNFLGRPRLLHLSQYCGAARSDQRQHGQSRRQSKMPDSCLHLFSHSQPKLRDLKHKL